MAPPGVRDRSYADTTVAPGTSPVGTTTSFYLDGEPLPAIPANPLIGATPTNPRVLHVGAFAGEPSSTQGFVDELAIFRDALPSEAIRAIATAASSTFCRRNDQGCVAPPPGLVSWYRFEQMEGALDDAGQAPNEPLLLSSSSLRAPGRVGAGLRLREPGGFARTLSATAKLSFSSAFTLSVWIRPTNATGARTLRLRSAALRVQLLHRRVYPYPHRPAQSWL